MRSAMCSVLLISSLMLAACDAKKSACDDKLVILEGNGRTEIESQWDACVARNASKIAFNQLTDTQLAEVAVQLCKSYANRYSIALQNSDDKLSSDDATQLVEYKNENLLKIAVSELARARRLGCEAK